MANMYLHVLKAESVYLCKPVGRTVLAAACPVVNGDVRRDPAGVGEGVVASP